LISSFDFEFRIRVLNSSFDFEFRIRVLISSFDFEKIYTGSRGIGMDFLEISRFPTGRHGIEKIYAIRHGIENQTVFKTLEQKTDRPIKSSVYDFRRNFDKLRSFKGKAEKNLEILFERKV